MAQPLLDKAALADRLNTSRRHIEFLVAERRIPYVKVGRFVRFDPAAIEEWVAAQAIPCSTSTSTPVRPRRALPKVPPRRSPQSDARPRGGAA